MKTVRTKATTSNEISALEAKNRLLAREAAAEGIVLLKNDGILPLAPQKIGLFGAGARTTIKGGTGSGEVNERYSVSIEQGLIDAGFSLVGSAWLTDYVAQLQAEKTLFNKNMAKKLLFGSANERINIMANPFQYPCGREITDADVADGGDVCVYVLARQAGECSERRLTEYGLRTGEIEHLTLLSKHFSRIIMVINCSAPMDISALDAIPNICAIILFGQPGMEGGHALADVMTGAVAPSGCLSTTWAHHYEDLPAALAYSHLKGHTDYEEYTEGLYVGYRYFDSFDQKPLYPFGFGMTYSTFSLEFLTAEINKTAVSVHVAVHNTGKYPGKKVVQLYVSVPCGELSREYQSLAAFGKTGILEAGQSQTLSLDFDLRDLAGYDEQNARWILEQGDYIIRVGEHSKNTQAVALITLAESAVTEVCKNLCVLKEPFVEISPDSVAPEALPDDLLRLSVDTAGIDTIIHDYADTGESFSAETTAILEQLSSDDLCTLLCGSGVLDRNPYFLVPGAAAYTSSKFVKHGLVNAALCDGPAGVRLQRTSVRYKNGTVRPVDAMIEMLEGLPKFMRPLVYGNPRKGELLYQYATMFPVGTSLAQTWNTRLMEGVGQAMAEEMTAYGATWLLAPGMNIQRNPLCGRNFEYYSEDPLLTGKMAAAITRGVQSMAGCYVTIKHFAANNQETNRNKSDSRVSERVLREIYLKAFGIAVKEGGAKSVMTSYNLLNGIYTANDYALCTDILRKEWGFGGVVMSDWFATGKGLAGNGAAISAGNDLIMPGGGSYIARLKEDLKNGVCQEAQLRICTGRVIECILQSGRNIDP